ncbi:MAG: helix-turn-helix transcriptional regulator [Deltaproteobacteria bacterium]|nr:helix-turn-helix transcriptional regulator [Deltaproteobacteria bacterium]
MRALMKKHPIEADSVELHFLGPSRRRNDAVELLKSLGFVDVSDAVPWRECFSYSDEQLPGACLAGARGKEGLTQKQLSELTGIPQRHISEMENGKRPIGKETARKFEKALNIRYNVFL